MDGDDRLRRRYKTNNDKFYKSIQWRAVRKLVLHRDAYLCQTCKRQGRITPATIVHHIVPVRYDSKMALEPDNLETMCASCNIAEHTERAMSLHASPLEGINRKIKSLKRDYYGFSNIEYFFKCIDCLFA